MYGTLCRQKGVESRVAGSGCTTWKYVLVYVLHSIVPRDRWAFTSDWSNTSKQDIWPILWPFTLDTSMQALKYDGSFRLSWHVDQRIHLKPLDLHHVGTSTVASDWPAPLLRISQEQKKKKELFGLVCVSDIIVNKWKLFYRTPPRQRLAAGWDFSCGGRARGNECDCSHKKKKKRERDGEIGKRD